MDVKRTTFDNAFPSSTNQVTTSSETKSSQGITGKTVNQALASGHSKTKRAAPTVEQSSHLSIFEPCGSESNVGAQPTPNEELPNAVPIIGQLADAVTSLRNTIVSNFSLAITLVLFCFLL